MPGDIDMGNGDMGDGDVIDGDVLDPVEEALRDLVHRAGERIDVPERGLTEIRPHQPARRGRLLAVAAVMVLAMAGIWVALGRSSDPPIDVTSPGAPPSQSTTIPREAKVDLQVRTVLGTISPVATGAATPPAGGVELPFEGTTYVFGPVYLHGALFESVTAAPSAGNPDKWTVKPMLRVHDDLDALVGSCFSAPVFCPSLDSSGHGRLALISEGSVLVVATANAQNFEPDGIEIAGLTRDQAEHLVEVLEGEHGP